MADKLNHPINLNCITPEQAIQGTIEMWTDMRNALGESPTGDQRCRFKGDWLCKHGYNSIFPSYKSSVTCDCFLCEFAMSHWYHSGFKGSQCEYCPICWPDDSQPYVRCRSNSLDYARAPISDILAYLKDEKNRRFTDG